MAGVDDTVPVSGTQNLGSYRALDSQLNVIEIEKVAITTDGGQLISPLSEATGQSILAELQKHTALLAQIAGYPAGLY